MTAVLSQQDPLRTNRRTSLDDNAVDYSPSKTDWREKYNEVVDMLAEARTELEDFRRTSEELEAELEAELTRTEKAHEDLKAKAARAELERDEWKTKFMTLQTTHNTTSTSLQRELDKLRQEFQQTKVVLRELEMGNDNLERNERAVSSTLAEMESKYSRILEEKILLEQELLEKAALEEESQRLKDELRESNVEIGILRDQVSALAARDNTSSRPTSIRTSVASAASTDDLLTTPPPADIDVAEVSPSSESLAEDHNTTPKASLSRPPANPFLVRTAQQDKSSPLTAIRNNSMVRSTTLPSFNSPTTTASPRSFMRPPVARAVSTATNLTNGSLAKNKGVQMVSEMRARFQNLEQKIHTRVPRLRMGSITNRVNSNGPATPVSSSPSIRSNTSTAKTSWESQRKSIDSRKSQDLDREKNNGKESDSTGWVLIMEDSPSPRKDKDRLREKRRLSNGPAPTSFKLTASSNRSTSPSQSTPANPLAISTGLRRPQSRLSGGASSSAGSRPQTPTFLPVPSSGLYSSTSANALKKSTGPNAMKRSSYGQTKIEPVPPLPDRYKERPITMPPTYRSASATSETKKALPDLPDLHNVTVRAKPSFSTSILSKSRIGRPSGGSSGRRSAGEPIPALDISDLRPRAGSSAGG